jgi:hypothetical protein
MQFTVRSESKFEAPGEQVWRVLKDFGGHYQFASLMEVAPIDNGVTEGLGAERELRLYDGTVIRQRILDLEEGRSMLIEIVESSLPIESAVIRIDLGPSDAQICFVAFEITYEPKYGVVGGVVGPLYKPILLSQHNLILRGLEHFVATGKPLGPELSD